MEIVVQPALELVKYLGSLSCTYFDYHFKFDEAVSDLITEQEALNRRKHVIDSKIQTEAHWGQQVSPEVEGWLLRVQDVNGQVQVIQDKVQRVKLHSKGRLGKHVLNMIEVVKRIHEQGSFPHGLLLNRPPAQGVELPTEILEGEVSTKEKVWENLMSSEVGMIGVCGIGGIGKTTIMKHINNDLLRLTQFDKVIWVTVSYPLNVIKIQETVALTMDKRFPESKDELRRAAELMKIMEGVRYVLILDDVWEKFSLKDVGIPEPTVQNGCKVVVTSRSIDLCNLLGCQIVKVQPLSEQESLSLFLDKVGRDILQIPNLVNILKLVVKECSGLPLAIVVIAASMKGVDDVYEWRNLLLELQERVRSVKGTDDEIFQRLRISYDRLKSVEIQKCFLYCSLYPEDFEFSSKELIDEWIDEGLIEELASRQAAYDRGRAFLNRLEKNCLLEKFVYKEGDDVFKVHDVVRDMAIKSIGPECGYMMKAGLKLTEVPDEHEWVKDVKKVSLMRNDIRKIPHGFSPKCYALSTLILKGNLCLWEIPESFFLAMPGLEILDLSETWIKALPNSVSSLENLTVLRLRHCNRLSYVPCLSKLCRLKKLDLLKSGIMSVPHGMEKLISLEYLDLFGTQVFELPMGMLSNLTRLQYLVLHWKHPLQKISGEELGGLSKLETLEATFYDLQDLNNFSKSRCFQGLTHYVLVVSGKNHLIPFEREHSFSNDRCLFVCSSKLGRDGIVLPNKVQKLGIYSCENLTSLNGTDLDGLRYCKIGDCEDMECVFDLVSRSSACIHNHPQLHKLEELHLLDLFSLQVLVRSSEGVPPLIFSNLKRVRIVKCLRLRKLFTVEQLHGLQNLEEIRVKDCMQMQEIIASEEGEVNVASDALVKFTFPRLMKLELDYLPNLKSICSARGVMVCVSLNSITIRACQKLKRIPLHLPLLDNGEPSLPPRLEEIRIGSNQWWESLEWDNPKAKDLLCTVLECPQAGSTSK